MQRLYQKFYFQKTKFDHLITPSEGGYRENLRQSLARLTQAGDKVQGKLSNYPTATAGTSAEEVSRPAHSLPIRNEVAEVDNMIATAWYFVGIKPHLWHRPSWRIAMGHHAGPCPSRGKIFHWRSVTMTRVGVRRM